MNQQQYWDKAAQTKEFTTPFQAEAFENLVPKDSLILDVGCGYGRTLNQLSSLGYKNLHGLDFSSEMIQRGCHLHPHLHLSQMESGLIDLPDNSADAVILFAVLTCIWKNEEQEALIQEIHRILKPGGILYVNDFLLNTDDRNLTRYRQYETQYPYGVFELPEGAVLRHHDFAWIQTLLSPFTLLQLSPLTFTTMNGHKSNGFYYFGRLGEIFN